jgi:hypothetical protein
MVIELDDLIKKIDQLPDDVINTKIMKKAGSFVQGMVADRVLNEGKNIAGRVMKYAKSTKAFKDKTGRDSSKKTLVHQRNRIWSAFGVLSVSKTRTKVGWRKGSEGRKLAEANQKRDPFSGLARNEQKKLNDKINDLVNEAMKKVF